MAEDLLIVFTDEVGSTARDCGAVSEDQILAPRIALFSDQLACLSGNGWKVLKSVGDALVIKYEGDPDSIAQAIHSIFLSWKRCLTSGTRFRVAVHCPVTPSLATGANLRTGLTQLGHPDPPALWPSFSSLDDDLFGLEMNLAARLASLPTGNAFVMSEHVLAKKEIRDRLRSFLTEEYYISPRVPVTNLKGFEGYLTFDGVTAATAQEENSGRQLFWVHEILPKTSVAGHSSLIADSRCFQVMRTIIAPYVLADKKNSKKPLPKLPHLDFATKLAEVRLRELLGSEETSTAFGYHSDALFLITETWEGPPARLDRSAPKKAPLLRTSQNSKTEEYAQFPTTHILFSSTFSDAVDRLFSEKIRTGEKTDSPHNDIEVTSTLLSESHSILKRSCWLPNAFPEGKMIYYLLIFQVKNTAMFSPDDVRTFEKIDNRLENLEPVSWGILRGGADGYVLYRAENDGGRDRKYIGALNTSCNQSPTPDSFLSRTIPLLVHKLELVWSQKVPELSQAKEFSDNQHWQHFMDPKRADKPQ